MAITTTRLQETEKEMLHHVDLPQDAKNTLTQLLESPLINPPNNKALFKTLKELVESEQNPSSSSLPNANRNGSSQDSVSFPDNLFRAMKITAQYGLEKTFAFLVNKMRNHYLIPFSTRTQVMTDCLLIAAKNQHFGIIKRYNYLALDDDSLRKLLDYSSGANEITLTENIKNKLSNTTRQSRQPTPSASDKDYANNDESTLKEYQFSCGAF